MENKNVRSSRSNPALVSGTEGTENIIHHSKDNMKSYTTARGEMPSSDTPAGQYNQPTTVKKNRGTTEFCGLFCSRVAIAGSY